MFVQYIKTSKIFCNILCILFPIDEAEMDEAPVMDAYDMADPVNILAKLPADFYDKIVRRFVIFKHSWA